jgi:hypothetical protein
MKNAPNCRPGSPMPPMGLHGTCLLKEAGRSTLSGHTGATLMP